MTQGISNRLSIFLAIVLLSIFAGMVTRSIAQSSPVVDETTEVSAGYYMLTTGDFSNNTGNPILLSLLSAVPLLTADLAIPPHSLPYFEPHSYSDLQSWFYSVTFLAANQSQVETIFWRARLMILIEALLAGIFVFQWSRELYGRAAGLLALLFFVFSPNILAHSGVATYDIGFTLAILAGTYSFQRLLFQPKGTWLLLAGLLSAVVLLSKNTWPLFLMIIAALAITTVRQEVGIWPWLPARLHKNWVGRALSYALSCVASLFMAWLLINIAYGFQGTMQPLGTYLPHLATKNHSLALLAGVPIPFPSAFVESFLFRLSHAASGQPTFLLGSYSPSIAYHPVAFLTKVPLGFLLLLPITLWLSSRTKERQLRWKTDEIVLLIPPIVIFIVVATGNIKVGFRHLLPMMPFLFIFAGKLACFIGKIPLWSKVVISGLVAWFVLSSVAISPHYLAYFNELAGGPENGYRVLVDSNLDWGQDLKGLKAYMVEQKIDRIKLSYFGSADPAWYEMQFDYLPSIGLRQPGPNGLWWFEPGYVEECAPTTGTIAISATNLQGVLFQNKQCFAWLQQYKPIAKVGYSIFIYEIKEH